YAHALRQPLRAGQRYWLSWDMFAISQINAQTGIPLGEIDVQGATVACGQREALATQLFKPTDPPDWIHVCAEFVPSGDYSYLIITAKVANGVGSGYAGIDGLRLSPYVPPPTDPLWPNCASLPLNRPFP